jgi:hypothetical protein
MINKIYWRRAGFDAPYSHVISGAGQNYPYRAFDWNC